MNESIRGCWPAVLTPFQAEGAIDQGRLRDQAGRLLAAGCDGVLLFGHAVEGLLIGVKERCLALERLLLDGVKADQLMVDISATALEDAIALGRHAGEQGVMRQALSPFLLPVQLPDRGVVDYVSAVIEGVCFARQRLLVDCSSRPGGNASSRGIVEALGKRYASQVVALCDAFENVAAVRDVAGRLPQVSVFVHAEEMITAAMEAGAAGSISSLGNVGPRLLSRAVHQSHDFTDADAATLRALKRLSSGTPWPAVCVEKAVLAARTDDASWLRVRVPLSSLDDADREAVQRSYLGARRLED